MISLTHRAWGGAPAPGAIGRILRDGLHPAVADCTIGGMKVLVCIPHYYDHAKAAAIPDMGSSTASPGERASTVRQALRSIVTLISPQVMIGSSGTTDVLHDIAEPLDSIGGKILLCVTGDNHLLNELPSFHLVEGRRSDVHPTLLGYLCRQVFEQHLGEYDLYCFIEDDVAIVDPDFFAKVARFYATFGEDRILLPNRYEHVHHRFGLSKVYLDGPVHPDHAVLAPGEHPPELAMGDTVFELAANPFGMCYVITDGQLRDWSRQPDFLRLHADLKQRMDTFEVAQIPFGGARPLYKPARRNLSYLEVRHVSGRLSMARSAVPKILAAIGK